MECGQDRDPAQSGRQGSICSFESEGQTRRRGLGTLHAKAFGLGFYLVENGQALQEAHPDECVFTSKCHRSNAVNGRSRAVNRYGNSRPATADRVETELVAAEPATAKSEPVGQTKEAVGHKGQSPERQVVTTAQIIVMPSNQACNTIVPSPSSEGRGLIDYVWLRQELSMHRVLSELDWLERLHGTGPQLRGPCPIHGTANPRSRTFSVHLDQKIFHCFDQRCGAHGNVLDLWMKVRKLPLYEAALELMQRFQLAAPETEKRNP